MPVASLNGISLYYEIQGRGEPLVLIAGMLSDHTAWSAVVEELSKNFRVVVFDNRGIGQSSTPDTPYTIPMFGEDVLALMDALKIPSAYMAGQSMGGAVLQWLAAHHPARVKAAVLCTTFAKPAAPALYAFAAATKLMEHGVPRAEVLDTLFPWIFSAVVLDNPKMLATIKEADRKNPYPQSLAGYKHQLAALHGFDSHVYLAQIKVPVLAIAGAQDRIAPAPDTEELARSIPGAKMHVVPNCGHAIQVEQPAVLCQLIRDFLRA